jgi:hypothetical protein
VTFRKYARNDYNLYETYGGNLKRRGHTHKLNNAEHKMAVKELE